MKTISEGEVAFRAKLGGRVGKGDRAVTLQREDSRTGVYWNPLAPLFTGRTAELNDACVFPKHCLSASESYPPCVCPVLFSYKSTLVSNGTQERGPVFPPASPRHSRGWSCGSARFPQPNEPSQGTNPVAVVPAIYQPPCGSLSNMTARVTLFLM